MVDKADWIPTTLHTDLSDAHPGETYWMHANGRRYELCEHTARSRAEHRAIAPHLAAVPDEELTHYAAEPVLLPHDQVIRVHLEHTLETFDAEQGSRGSYHSAIVPPPEGAIPDKPSHHHINWTSTAMSLIFHHPDLITHDPKVAKVVFDYMENEDTSKKIAQLIDRLALTMAKLGPPTPKEARKQGWATLVPMKVTRNGVEKTYYQQEPSQEVVTAAGDVMTAMMIATKNDPALKDKKWTQPLGTSVLSHTAPGAATVLAEVGEAGDDWSARLTNEGEQHGLQTTLKVTDAGTRTVNLKMDNTYVRWLGVYVAFYDADGALLNISDWNFDSGIPGISGLESKNYRCLGYVQPVNTFMAIPIFDDPGRLNEGEGVTFEFPSEQAASAKVFGCGLGTGSIPFGKAVVLGAIATGLSNIAIPTFLLGFAVASQKYKSLYRLTKKKEVMALLIAAGVLHFGRQFGNTAVAHHKMNFHALSSLGSILFQAGFKELLLWCETSIAEGELEDAIPFSGWIAAALNIATGVAQMAETITEVATSPWFIDNTISLSITSKVSVHPDPRHNAWPRGQAGTVSRCVAKMIYKNQARPTVSQTFDLPADFTDPEIEFSFAGNTLGGEVKIEADFYIDDWLAGQAQSGWLRNEEDVIKSTTLYLVEKPKPITATSKFKHSAIVRYEGGRYQWHDTAEAPMATIADLKSSSNANEISACVGLALSQRHSVLGMAWKAAGTGLAPCSGGGTDTQIYAVQSMDIPGRPMGDAKFVTCGTMHQSMLLYDPYPPKFEMQNGRWVTDEKTKRPVPDPGDVDLGSYYIDPSQSEESLDDGGGYHLRRVEVDGAEPFEPPSYTLSHGRFPFFPDHLTLHPSGHVVGISQANSKVMVCDLHPEGAADKDIPVARASAGRALIDNREGLLFRPIAVSCTYDGTLLILDQIFSNDINQSRIQAFDLLGRPVQCFQDAHGTATAILPVPNNVVYLDLAAVGNKNMTYMFLLYYTGSGAKVSDYKVAVYKYGEKSNTGDMSAIVTTNGVAAARICVDMWHTLYTLNYQMVKNADGQSAGPKDQHTGPAGRTVPSISEWLLPEPGPDS